MTADPPSLAGYTVAVTAARRHDELAALFARRGARVVAAPAIQIVPLADDAELRRTTQACLDATPDITIVTTGIGFRAWMETADAWGVGDALRKRLRDSRVLARGPKARGAIRAAGLTDEWSPASESMDEVVTHLLATDLSGARVVLQQHGEPLPDVEAALRGAGASVLVAPVYRWAPAADPAPLVRLVELVAAGAVDAVTFTSAPAVASLLRCAADTGLSEAVLGSLREEVVAGCVGAITAAPLLEHGVSPVVPDRARIGNLVRAVADALPGRRGRLLSVRGHVIDVRSHAAVVDDRVVALTPATMAVLSALAESPGQVRSRADLLARLPGEASDEHAVEMAVTRLRAALGDAQLVQTVVKRGYRLACDPVVAARTRDAS